MRRRLWSVVRVGLFLVGTASLALTIYAWIGDWPRETRAIVDHYRSLRERAGRPPEPLVENAAARPSLSLNGTWRAVIDPYRAADTLGVAARAMEPRDPSDLAEFSYANGLTLAVPGDWNTQDPRLVFYRGVVWYERRFEYHGRPGRRRFLYFGAANYRASVFVNGKLVGEHEGGFTPFNYEVTGHLHEGENLLVVKVDNEHGDDDVPTPVTDWHNYGGLTRDVLLLDLPAVFVRSWEVRLDATHPGKLLARVVVDRGGEGSSDRVPVIVAIPELGVRAEALANTEGMAELSLDAEPARWSPADPKLYRVEISAGDDRVADEVGFRTIAVRGDQILLNGEPVFLRGVALHEEALDGGRAFSREHAETLLDWAADLGANFVRLAHYPHNENVVRAADRRGFLVWSEIPVYWSIDFDNPETLERARRQFSEMIARDHSRAAVVLWSIGNETPDTPARLRFMQALAAHVRELDASRLVTAAMLTGEKVLRGFLGGYYLPALLGWERERWVMNVDDPLADEIDVPAINEYFGWYYSGAIGRLGPFSSHAARAAMLDNLDRIRLSVPGGKPLIVSEFGAGAVAGWRAPESTCTVFSEDYQALVYQRQIAMLERQPDLAGVSPWVLKDFRSPLRMYQGVQDYWNRKGLVSDDGRRKLAFGVLRDWYHELATRRSTAQHRPRLAPADAL